ncbi:helix-turn-helix domain-containing protein [Streptomyces sp. 061-3]|uniref:helix-turn-helix domain-containing protein n=1 Tax=Streptomyces sp. 061-3 TaxID=2789268 RepID=UPI003980A0B8
MGARLHQPWAARYAQGGGLTDARRAARERIRLQPVKRFGGGGKNREIADALRVGERSVERWLRQWRERGEAGSAPGARRAPKAQREAYRQAGTGVGTRPAGPRLGGPVVDSGPSKDTRVSDAHNSGPVQARRPDLRRSTTTFSTA